MVAPYWLYYELIHQSFVPAFFVVLIQVSLQILVTDIYRRLVHRKGWLKLPLVKLLPIVFTSWLLLTAQYLLIVFILFSIRYDTSFLDENILLGALAGGTRYLAIWLLGFHLYHFSRQSAKQAARAARNAQLATEAQLAKLSNELNPHFFFNALNGIKALTREDPARARDAIDRLSALLRYSLSRSNQAIVSLAEEMTIIKEYLTLEQIRLEERLAISWTLPDEYSECELPPLSLHTLVENAVKHGISRLTEGGVVDISLVKTSEGWVFTVCNPCSPIPPSGTRVRAEKPDGTGIRNLRQRLALQYGSSAHFDFQRTDSSAVATLFIPL